MSCVIVIPVYKTHMTSFERASLLRLRQLFSKNVYLVAPDGLPLGEYFRLWPDIGCERFPSFYFSDISAYNKLMLSSAFYLRFSFAYDWMLVHQLDAFLFHADLQKFCGTSYDYFGAPWLEGQLVHRFFVNPRLLKLFGTKVYVGNGGLSLRRIESTLNLIRSKSVEIGWWRHNEDAFYAYWGIKSKIFRSCPLNIAANFSFEKDPEALYSLNNFTLPFGCHGLPKYSQGFYAEIINPLLAKIEGADCKLI